MGIEERLDATISAVDGLHNVLNEFGFHFPDQLARLQKRIQSAKFRLNSVEDDIKKRRAAAVEHTNERIADMISKAEAAAERIGKRATDDAEKIIADAKDEAEAIVARARSEFAADRVSLCREYLRAMVAECDEMYPRLKELFEFCHLDGLIKAKQAQLVTLEAGQRSRKLYPYLSIMNESIHEQAWEACRKLVAHEMTRIEQREQSRDLEILKSAAQPVTAAGPGQVTGIHNDGGDA